MHSLKRVLRLPVSTTTSSCSLRRLSSHRRPPPHPPAATGDDERNDAWETAWLPGDSPASSPAPAAPWESPTSETVAATIPAISAEVDPDTKAFVADMDERWAERRAATRRPRAPRPPAAAEGVGGAEAKKAGADEYRTRKQRVHAALWVKEIDKMEEARLGGGGGRGAADDIDRLLDSCSDSVVMAGKKKCGVGIASGRTMPNALERSRNRASPAPVVKLYEHLSNDQKGAIADMGLETMLDIKCHTLHNPVINWLGPLYDKESRVFLIPGRGRIPLDAHSIYRTLALPRGEQVVRYGVDFEIEGRIAPDIFPGHSSTPKISEVFTILKDMVESDDKFKKLWMMYLTCTILAPTTCNKVSNRVYPILINDISQTFFSSLIRKAEFKTRRSFDELEELMLRICPAVHHNEIRDKLPKIFSNMCNEIMLAIQPAVADSLCSMLEFLPLRADQSKLTQPDCNRRIAQLFRAPPNPSNDEMLQCNRGKAMVPNSEKHYDSCVVTDLNIPSSSKINIVNDAILCDTEENDISNMLMLHVPSDEAMRKIEEDLFESVAFPDMKSLIAAVNELPVSNDITLPSWMP